MAIDIKFDLVNNPEPPTIILATRNGKKLGELDAREIELSDKFNDVSEMTFTLYKYYDGKLTNLWDKVINFKLIYCKEWDKWFEITVELDETNEIKKTVFAKQLGQAELSQIMLYGIFINQDGDPNWTDENDKYEATILYNPDNPELSLLDRLLKDKAAHYSIAYVDPDIAKEQRTFEFDDTSIYDAFQDIAEEIGCLFVFNSNSDENGKIQRTISVYDLWQKCNDCGYRGEFVDTCPKCGSQNIRYGYGDDTTIFVTYDELASDNIQLSSDTESVKNCFKLEAGDDLMTATIRNCNPNGTDYIWRFSDIIKDDMSEELINKLESYDDEYKYYYSEYVSDIDSNILSDYNNIVDKYKGYNEDLQKINTPIKGYSSLMNAYYNVVDLYLYLKSGLMPSVEISETSASEQAELLTRDNLSPVAVSNIDSVSLATLNTVVLSMAKVIVKSTYKVQVHTSEMIDDGETKKWKGSFDITNYSDEEDTATSSEITIDVNDEYELFVRQKIEKILKKEDNDDVSISGLFKKDYDAFCNELKKYALNPLISFRDACQACIDILIEQGVADNQTWGDDTSGAESNLYEKLYTPYYNKLKAIESEIKIREDEINIISGVYDTNGELITKGLENYIDDYKILIQDKLDFQKYLGDELWLEFCAYRREDKYSNDNYISDGLNNAELFKRALEFFDVAENEIYKSSELQHSISTDLKNLLAIEKFKPLVNYFKVGNWIRVQIDNKIYKLRLLEYEINYNSFDNISVEFSDIVKVRNGITDVENILSQASSMSSSYSSVKRQASQGKESNDVLNDWISDGLNVTNTKIVGTNNQNQVWDKNGILCREYDPITDTYSDEQLKIINSTIAITDNNWETTKTAIGKYFYIDPSTGELKTAYGVNGETIVGKFILGEKISMQNESGNMVFDGNGLTITSVTDDGVGTMTFDDNGLMVNHGNNTVTISPKFKEVMNITNGEDKVFEVNEDGELSINGNIIARSLRLENGVTIDSGVITDLATVATSGSYNDLSDTPTLSKVSTTGDYNDLDNKPELAAVATTGSYNDLNNKPNLAKVSTTGEYNDLNNIPNFATVATSGSYNDLSDIPTFATIAITGSYNDLKDIDEFKAWIQQEIQNAVNS